MAEQLQREVQQDLMTSDRLRHQEFHQYHTAVTAEHSDLAQRVKRNTRMIS